MTKNKILNTSSKISTAYFIALLASGTLLTACATINPMKNTKPATVQNEKSLFPRLADLFRPKSEERLAEKKKRAYIASLPITHPLRANELQKIWNKIDDVTTVFPISDRRIRIHAEGTLFANENISEQNFFLRAADETTKAGYDGFIVAHLDYYSPGPQLFVLTPSYNFSSKQWIGNYEDFLESRNEKNMFSTRRSVNNKVLNGVIVMMKKSDHPNRDRFSAQEIYTNFITYKAR